MRKLLCVKLLYQDARQTLHAASMYEQVWNPLMTAEAQGVWQLQTYKLEAHLLGKSISSSNLLLDLHSLNLGLLDQYINILLSLLQLGQTLQQHRPHGTLPQCFARQRCVFYAQQLWRNTGGFEQVASARLHLPCLVCQ